MNAGQAKSLVVAGVGTATLLASVDSVRQGKRPPLAVFVGAAVSGFVLLAVADPAPNVAGGLAALLLVGALLTNGVSAAQSLAPALDRK